MFLSLWAVIALLPFSICDISLLAFDDDQCAGGRVGVNIHSNPGAVDDASGCQSLGDYSSVNILSVDAGFKCNIYADDTCQSFITSATQAGCIPVIGKAVICFNQGAFDDPLAGTTRGITLGANTIVVSYPDPGGSVGAAIEKACGSGICDSSVPATSTFNHAIDCETGLVNTDGTESLTVCDHHETCTQTITVEGQFTNTDQRDYMKEVLKTTFAQPPGGFPVNDGTGDQVRNLVSFAGAQITDAKGASLALMTVTHKVECAKAESNGFDCGGNIVGILKPLVAAVPGVGEVAAAAWEVGCATSQLANGGS